MSNAHVQFFFIYFYFWTFSFASNVVNHQTNYSNNG